MRLSQLVKSINSEKKCLIWSIKNHVRGHMSRFYTTTFIRATLLFSFVLSSFLWAHSKSALDSEKKSTQFIETEFELIRDKKQLTFAGARSGEGYFSADGNKMIYQSEREEGNPFYQMYVLDLSSGRSTRISTGVGMTTCGWLHPHMKKAMWSSTHHDKKLKDKVAAEFAERNSPVKKRYSWNYDDQYEIYESDLTGKKIKRLTNSLGYDAEGAYSPDGQWIVFASNRSQYIDKLSADEKKLLEKDASFAMEIYIMRADGGGVRRLTHSPGYDGGPFFSADGKRITWRRFTPDGHRAEIYTMNMDGTEQVAVTALGAMSWAPFFHPSGEYIIFTSSVLGYANFELFIVDSNGQGLPVRVSQSEGFDGLPTFSPDGTQISWTYRGENGESQIYLAQWDHQKALSLIEKQRPPTPQKLSLSSAVTEADTRQIVEYLASEKFKGRMTGSAEEKVYTEEIARLFKSWGLLPALGNDLIQTFDFTSGVQALEGNQLQLKGRMQKDLMRGEDYQVLSYSQSGEFNAAPVVFAGYGIKAPAVEKQKALDSYLGLDVSGKWVMILEHVPKTSDKNRRQHLLTYSRPQHKITAAKNAKAAGIIFISDSGLRDIKFEGSLSDNTLPVVKVSTKTVSALLKGSSEPYAGYEALEKSYSEDESKEGFNFNSQYLSASIKLQLQKSRGRNVVGVLKSGYKGKSILLGAHGDHLGQGEMLSSSLALDSDRSKIHFGADDNASGVAGVLELAHYYSANKKQLKKDLYFAVWSGEEVGVLGSSDFVRSWNRQKTADFSKSFEAAYNMDMVGRLRDKLQVQGLGSAKEWKGIAEEVALVTGLPLILTEDPHLPTDAMALYLGGVPSISFFTGSHEDYHSPRDTAEKINHAGLVQVTDAVKNFIDKTAQIKTSLLTYQKVEGGAGQRLEGRSFRIYLGTIPDYSQEGVKGIKISGASKNSPAEKAGLKPGDVIVEFDRTSIENLYDYVYALQSAQANQKTGISVLRDGKKYDLEIVPLLKE